MTDFEIAFAARCAAITDTRDDSDWLDVQRRVRRSSRRRKLTIALIAAAAVLIVAPAFALRGSIIDFFSADPAPANIVRDFGSLEAGAPPGMAPGIDPEQARKVASFPFDGKESVLYVAPTKGGGFCASWTQAFFGGCRTTRTVTPTQAQRFAREGLGAFQLIGVSASGGAEGFRVIGGHVLRPDSTVQLRYQDGQSVNIPQVWVSKPIDAGFFFYRIPNAHRKAGHRATAVVLLDKSGNEIARSPLKPRPRDVVHRLPNGARVLTPADAIWAMRRTIIAFRSSITGQMISLSVAPSRTGGRCYWWGQGYGCPPARKPSDPPVAVGLSAAPRAVRLFGTFAPNVAKAVLNYEDGTTDRVIPTEGYVLTEISPDHYPRGHRLVKIVGYDALGVQVGSSPFNPADAGLYPCLKPKDYGYGVKQCP